MGCCLMRGHSRRAALHRRCGVAFAALVQPDDVRRGEKVGVPEHIDLRPLLAHPDAAEMLMLARGQLNRAFRTHGLLPPDSLFSSESVAPAQLSTGDLAELDDPVASGVAHATARFGELFASWAAEMPRELVQPVLQILVQTYATLNVQPEHNAAARAAVLQACEFLQEHAPSELEWGRGGAGGDC
jgi:hypothetical protein